MTTVNPNSLYNYISMELLNFSATNGVGQGLTLPPLDDEQLVNFFSTTKQLPTLPGPLRMLGGLSLESLVEAINSDERKTVTTSSVDNLQAKAKERKEANDKKLEEIQERLRKMEQKGPLQIFMKIFKVIALVVSAIASVATVAAGVLTGNPLLVAAGVFMAALVLDSVLSEATDGKISIAAGTEAIAKACGASDETAKWIGMGVTVGLTIIGAALSFGAGFSSSAAKISQEAASQAMKIVLNAQRLTNVAGGVLSVGTGAGTIGESVLDYQVQSSFARTKELDAILQRIQTAIQNEQDFLEVIMKKYQDMVGKVSDIVKENNEAQAQILGGGFSAPSMA